jgi:hypothetical protein
LTSPQKRQYKKASHKTKEHGATTCTVIQVPMSVRTAFDCEGRKLSAFTCQYTVAKNHVSPTNFDTEKRVPNLAYFIDLYEFQLTFAHLQFSDETSIGTSAGLSANLFQRHFEHAFVTLSERKYTQ